MTGYTKEQGEATDGALIFESKTMVDKKQFKWSCQLKPSFQIIKEKLKTF